MNNGIHSCTLQIIPKNPIELKTNSLLFFYPFLEFIATYSYIFELFENLRRKILLPDNLHFSKRYDVF